MNLSQKVKLATNGAEEVLTTSELENLLETNSSPRGYIGFEISGFFHIGNGMILGRQVSQMLEAGINMNILLADWHSLINNKLGGDMDAIKMAGEYFELAFRAMGATGPKVEYVWGSDLVNTSDYWMKVIQVAKNATLTRFKRTLPIMGRKDSSDMEAAFLFYPPMQAADIFEMDLDIALGGMDQRKIHILAREVAERVGYKKPVCFHTPMLMGLKGPGSRMDISKDMAEIKMSKSKPETCIFLHDGPKTIKRKLKKAHCPQGEIGNNSVLDIARLILFNDPNFKLQIERPEKFGGDIKFDSFESLTEQFAQQSLHPLDLKNAIASSLADVLKDARRVFEKHDDVMQTMSNLTGVAVEFE